MKAGNPIEAISESVYSALLLHLPEVEYTSQTPQQRRDGIEGVIKKRRPRMDEVEIYVFPQVWGSTALGFGGMGGSTITSAYTVVVISNNEYASVYFNGGLAYTRKAGSALMQDVAAGNMASVSDASKYNQ